MTLADQTPRGSRAAASNNAITRLLTTERDLPIAQYDSQNVLSIVRELRDISQHGLRMIGTYEQTHKDRAGVLQAVDRRIV